MTEITAIAASRTAISTFINLSRAFDRRRIPMILFHCVALVTILILLGMSVQAQNIQFTQGSVGSGLDNTMSVSLRIYPGRGGTSLPVNLNYSSRVWKLKYLHTPGEWNLGQYWCGNSVVEAVFAEYSTAGWTSSLDVPVLEWPLEHDQYNYNGKPINPDCSNLTGSRIKRVYVHMPDGSTHELRDGDQPYVLSSVNHNGTFYSADGSRMKYDSSTSSLWMPDGSHYVLGNSTTQFIDRAGNTLNYNNSTRVWTDTLGRSLTNPLPVSPTDDADIEYTMPGFNGASITYTFHWRHLSETLAPGVSGVLPMADEYLPDPGGTPTLPSGTNAPASNSTPSLFQSYYDESDVWTDVVGHNQEREANFDPIVLAGIDLPNNLTYQFYYNEYAELTKTIYPTGAYDTVTFAVLPPIGDVRQPYAQAVRGVTERKLSPSGSGSDLITWTYSVTDVDQRQVITATAPDGSVVETRRHNFTVPTFSHPHPSQYWPFGFESSINGSVYEVRTYAPSGMGGAMLRRSLTEYAESSSVLGPRHGYPYDETVYAYRNARPVKEVSLIMDTGGYALAKTMTYTYDTTYQTTTGVDRTSSTESQFADVAYVDPTSAAVSALPVGSPARITETTYSSDSAYRNRYILGVATESVIKDGSGNPVYRAKTTYDEFSSYPLVTYSDLTGSDYNDPGSTAVRAYPTTVRRCLDVSSSCSSYLDTHVRYDQVGNVVSTWNERGIKTDTEYAINSSGSSNVYHHAYPTKVTTAVPDTNGTHGSSTAFESTTAYDWRTGLVTSTTDVNGQTTTISYADDSSNLDPLLRPRKVTRPDGGWTKTSYHDVVGTPGTTGGLYVYSQSQMDAGRTSLNYQFFDALGRKVRSQSNAGGTGYLTIDTQYDTQGRTYRTSNSYTTTLDGSVNPLGKWTTITGYDALNRVTGVTLPDSTTIGTSYSGAYTTVTDQAGRQRRQKVDAQGRIVRVDEPDPDSSGSLGSVDSPNLASYYDYDTLGNLIHIQQGKGSVLQNRYFKYDALSRLTYERQIEATGYFSQSDSLTGNSSWSRKLVYDETISSVAYTGLLTGICDARNVCAQNRYDQLNRVTQISYSDRTPTVTNNYDQAHTGYFNNGRLTEVITASVSDDTGTSYDDSVPETRLNYDFDLMGRTVKSSQSLGSYVYNLAYKYNIGGQLTQETYPSGRVVNFGYDDASRLSNVNGGQGHVYADAFTYAGHGGVASFTMGNGATVNLGYGTNGRLQLSDVTLVKNGTTLQKYECKYGQIASGSVDTTKNNGQLAQVESWIGTEQQYRQQYSFDTLGRLTESVEKYGASLASTAYDVKYRYDFFGNREQHQSDNSGNTAITQKWVESGDISTTNNRFSSNVTYDAAGNITADPRFRNLIYGYDANGRQNYAAAANGSGPVTAVFDGAGQRVANKAGGAMNVMVYDFSGKLVAEYGTTAPTTSNLQYVTADYQGSTRVVTDSSGVVANRRDYLPFGEEIGATVGSRTSNKGFGWGDMARQKYAGMETDDATGMAHTLWRKQDNWSGRWTSPDPYGGSMTPANPQSFNRYSYVDNDPVNLVDPTGLYPNNYHDATSNWQDVSGYFWGDNSFDTNSRRSIGQRIVGIAEGRHDALVKQGMALRDWKHAYFNLDDDGARAILDANPSIGYFEAAGSSPSSEEPAGFSIGAIAGVVIGGANFSGASIFQTPPPFSVLWANHPGEDNVNNSRGPDGNPLYPHQCAMRFFTALKLSGFDMSSFRGATIDGIGVRAYEIGKWLTRVLGPPITVKGSANEKWWKYNNEIAGRQGIMLLKYFWGVGNSQGHIDLYSPNGWGGPQLRGGDLKYIRSTLDNRGGVIQFWPIP